jgi:hypothetical protein
MEQGLMDVQKLMARLAEVSETAAEVATGGPAAGAILDEMTTGYAYAVAVHLFVVHKFYSESDTDGSGPVSMDGLADEFVAKFQSMLAQGSPKASADRLRRLASEWES